MHIVLDSNVLIGNFHFTSNAGKVFLEGLPKTEHSLYVPQVVIEETVNKQVQWLKQSVKELNTALGKLQSITGLSLISPLSKEDIDAVSTNYRHDLISKLGLVHATILGYPKVSHEDLVGKAIAHHRPFNEQGTGYRDMLIWHNVLDLMTQKSEAIALITNDGDFVTRDGDLHPDLLQDMERLKISIERVVPFRDLQQFVDKHIVPTLESLEDIQRQLNEDKYPGFSIRAYLTNNLTNEDFPYRGWGSDREEVPPQEAGLPGEAENPTLDGITKLISFDVSDVRKLSGNEIRIEVDVEAECLFSFFLHKSDVYGMLDDTTVSIWGDDWNEWYAAAEAVRSVNMQLDIIFDTQEAEIVTLNMISISEI